MRLAAVAGRATLITDHAAESMRGIDVEHASGALFDSDTQALYPRWIEFREWASLVDLTLAEVVDPTDVTNPVPRPRQVFAIGVNYSDHAREAGLDAEPGPVPSTFTKFPASLADPNGCLQLAGSTVDWEVELVAVLGAPANHVGVEGARTAIAGFAVGQDFSERTVQMAGSVPQFSLAKSYPGFGPIGPWVTTLDELPSPADLELVCEVNGEVVQRGGTGQMIWSVPELIVALSAVCPLLPGDVIFTGTPSGVGAAQTPPRYLTSGDVVTSSIEGLGTIQQACRAPTTSPDDDSDMRALSPTATTTETA